jgi:AraC-like DNA-binding protein
MPVRLRSCADRPERQTVGNTAWKHGRMVNPRGTVGPSDALGESLDMLRLTGALYCRADAGAPWGVEFPALPGYLTMPIVLSGSCVLEVGDSQHHLHPGSAALLSRGSPHRLVSAIGAPTVPLFELPVEELGDRYERMRIGGPGAQTRTAYAALHADDVLTRRVIAELPDVIVVDSWDDDEARTFADVLRLLGREATATEPGGEAVMTRLADVLVILVIRWWLRQAPTGATGWIAALRDPHVGRALARMHADTAHGWTVAELATESSLSRSAFAERFATLVGTPPAGYLAAWRLDQARAELERTDRAVSEIAARVGYHSDAAFSRAFKRHHGITPGEARRLLQLEPTARG